MVAIKNVFLFALGATASVLPVRDVSKIQTALNTVDADLKDLTSKANAYTGGTSGAIPVQQASSKLNNDIKAATDATNANAAATSAESTTIINYVTNTIKPDVTAAITAIINKKSQFTAANLYNTVKQQLATLNTSTGTLADALIAKASSDKKSAAQTAKTQILAEIKKGTDAYP